MEGIFFIAVVIILALAVGAQRSLTALLWTGAKGIVYLLVLSVLAYVVLVHGPDILRSVSAAAQEAWAARPAR